jgi:hypothetical protein
MRAVKMIRWMGIQAEIDPRPGGVYRLDPKGRGVIRNSNRQGSGPRGPPRKKDLSAASAHRGFHVFLAFLGGIVFLLAYKGWNEKDPHDLSKAIVTEIWIDLKEKRFLNPVNGLSHEPESDSSSLQRRRSIFSFLGLNNVAHHGNGSYSSSNHVPEEKRSEVA